jgi:hypothetical protein
LQTALSRIDHSALWQGVVCGTLLGAMLLVFNLVNNLGNLDATGETWLKNGLLIIMFALPGLAGYMASRETGRVKSGALAVLVTGLVSAVIGIVTLWVITLVFMDTLRHNALTTIDFQQSGMTNMGVFIVEGAWGGSIFLAVFSLAFGAGYGLLGSLLGAQYARVGGPGSNKIQLGQDA